MFLFIVRVRTHVRVLYVHACEYACVDVVRMSCDEFRIVHTFHCLYVRRYKEDLFCFEGSAIVMSPNSLNMLIWMYVKLILSYYSLPHLIMIHSLIKYFIFICRTNKIIDFY